MNQPRISPLQDAVEWLRVASQNDRISVWLAENDPTLLRAIHAVIQAGDSSHVPVPELTDDERQPEDVPNEALFIDVLDDPPPRHLKDVWQARGDHDDPFVISDVDEASARHDDDLLAKRMREDSDANLT